MATPEAPAHLRAAARAAYESARARRAAVPALLAAALLAASLAVPGGDDQIRAGAGAMLVAVAFGLPYLGGPASHAVVPGLSAGALPLFIPLALHEPTCCAEDCMRTCMVACAVSGAAAGALLGHRAGRQRVGWAWAAAAGTVALLVGALGCACLGWGGVGGMALALVTAALPSHAAARAIPTTAA